MFKFKTNLLRRADNFIRLRIVWDDKINYSYNNYLAINAMAEVRLDLYYLLIGKEPTYRRTFSYY